MALKAENEKIMQDYEALKEQMYDEMSEETPFTGGADLYSSISLGIAGINNQLIKSVEENNTDLASEWKRLEHEYSAGVITS